jgi:peptide/nickel transport system substrate-binding protein
VFRKRVFSGKSMMSVWSGLSNGFDGGDEPARARPTAQEQLQWPMWGQYYETNRKGGQAPDMPDVVELVQLYDAWRISEPTAEREKIWLRCSKSTRRRSSPSASSRDPAAGRREHGAAQRSAEGMYSWDPGAYFGFYHPDTFWFDPKGRQ